MKNVKFSRNGVDFEPTKQELKIILDDYAKQLGEMDKRIKVLEKALKIACIHIEAYSDSCYYCPRKQYCGEKCGLDNGENECIDWLMNYFKNAGLKE